MLSSSRNLAKAYSKVIQSFSSCGESKMYHNGHRDTNSLNIQQNYTNKYGSSHGFVVNPAK
jgi:hypothetical protein